MKYTINQFRRDFPDERACLQYIFNKRFPEAKRYYFVNGRKCFANPQGKQIHPVAGTVFEKSSTPLTLWFYAIYLFSTSRNGVSAKELQRQLGVTYKTAWRMGQQIRALMAQDGDKLTGIVEVDETYVGGRKPGGKDNVNIAQAMEAKTIVSGAVERGGKIRARVIRRATTDNVTRFLRNSVNHEGTRLMTDESPIYKYAALTYKREIINHKRKEYARGDISTNTIEGFWSQFKTSVRGTYHSVSRKHMQSYVDEFSSRRNWREDVFGSVMARI